MALDSLAGLGPNSRIFSVKFVTSSAKRGASADDTQAMLKRSGSIPRSSRTKLIASLRANAL